MEEKIKKEDDILSHPLELTLLITFGSCFLPLFLPLFLLLYGVGLLKPTEGHSQLANFSTDEERPLSDDDDDDIYRRDTLWEAIYGHYDPDGILD